MLYPGSFFHANLCPRWRTQPNDRPERQDVAQGLTVRVGQRSLDHPQIKAVQETPRIPQPQS